MSDIQRYNIKCIGHSLCPNTANKTGQWVEYSDHKKAIEAKEKEIDEILVAYYRQHKEKVTRDTMYVHLNRLKVLGRVKKVRNKFIYIEGDL